MTKNLILKFFLFVFALLAVATVFFGKPQATFANHIPYATGDIFAGVGNGQIYRYDQTGLLIEVLNTTSASSEQTGMCFDSGGNLYSTNWTAGNMSKFDNMGGLLTFPWGGPFSVHPESCVVDGAGNVYAGEVDGNNDIHKFDSAGTLLSSYNPAIGPRGLDWMDLAADQCTMLYTSEGSDVKRYDVCNDVQLTDFATGLTGPCFALRIRSNNEVLVTCRTQTYRLDSAGAIMQQYPIAGESLFAMNLDPDGAHFWTGGYNTRNIYKVNIASGAGTGAPVFTAAAVGPTLAGLALFGEPTVAMPEITLDPTTATNPAGTDHTVTATIKAGGNPVVGTLVSFSVTAGPNVGQVSDPGECATDPNCNTDAAGQTSWTYTSNGTVGVDVIQACFTDTAGVEHCAKAEKEWVDKTPPIAACVETTNPSGKNVPKAPGTGQNEDGFYQLSSSDNVGVASMVVLDGGSSFVSDLFATGDKVKITQAPGVTPSDNRPGPGVIVSHLKLKGDAILQVTDLAGNVTTVSCLVPPPPK